MEQKNNTRIWAAVDKTNPTDTKVVKKGYKLTAIDAYSQIKRATELFGPIGEGWGYDYEWHLLPNDTVLIMVTLWYDGDRSKYIKHCAQCCIMKKSKQGEVGADEDAFKKALTNAITKCLSMLGFNADVFLGKFDDNQYVQAAEEHFSKKKYATKDQKEMVRILFNLKKDSLSADRVSKIEDWLANDRSLSSFGRKIFQVLESIGGKESEKILEKKESKQELQIEIN